MYHPDDTPVYARKTGPWQTCPRNPQSRGDHERQFPEMPPWVHEHDGDLDALAQRVVGHGSALITGYAGTGKTKLCNIINSLLKGKVVNAAMTHAASRLMPNGKTLARVLNLYRYGKVADTTFIIDEIGMVPLSTWVRIGAWSLVGARFILLGDFRGQFEPIVDCWRGPDVETSGIIQQLARSLHVHLSINRRAAGDDAHFRFYTGLYEHVKDPDELDKAVRRAQATYPWRSEPGNDIGTEICDLVLVVSHHKRMRLNQYLNEARNKRAGVLVRCNETVAHHNRPQDMWLHEGMKLLCCCKSHPVLVNGVFYVVEEVDDGKVVVRMSKDYARDRKDIDEADAAKADKQEGSIELSHRDASISLRLSHSLCYASVQGLTLTGTSVLMLDTGHKHFSMRSLIVGASRVTSARNLHVATAEQERALMARTRPVLEPERVAVLPPEEEDESDDE